MLRYARKNALSLAPQLVSDIALLDRLLVSASAAPLSDIDPQLLAAEPRAVADMGTAESSMALILRAHAALGEAIAPATALSLQSSEPPPRRRRFLGGMPLVVKASAVAAVLSATGFVVSVATNCGWASMPWPGRGSAPRSTCSSGRSRSS